MNQSEVKFVIDMVNDYGVNSCFDNVDDENTLEDEGLWFECPVCGEPILFADWSFDEIKRYCPVCEEEYDA